MTAHRSAGSAQGKFVQISNDLIRNEELSVLARFIVCYVLSLPPDRRFTAEWLETKLPGYGTRSIRAALGELKERGYMRVTRRSRGRGKWEWEQIISDAPLEDFSSERGDTHETTCGNTSSQVSSSERLSSDEPSSDDARSDKELNTGTTKYEDQKMAGRRVSRRGAASSDAAKRSPQEIIDQVREAVASTCGQEDADNLTGGQALGLYFKYCNPKCKPVRSIVAYLSDILENATYVDTLLANTPVVCIPCWRYESDCQCPAQSAA